MSTWIDPLCFLAECRRRRLKQGLVVALDFSVSVRWDMFMCYFLVSGCMLCSVRYQQCNWLSGKIRLQNDLLCVEWVVQPYWLTNCAGSSTWSVTFKAFLLIDLSSCRAQMCLNSFHFLCFFKYAVLQHFSAFSSVVLLQTVFPKHFLYSFHTSNTDQTRCLVLSCLRRRCELGINVLWSMCAQCTKDIFSLCCSL